MNTKPPNPRPNILWIMSDQHHAACWSGGGRPEVRTPALTRIAASGVVFPSAYCNNPICGPSRACFLSGQYVLHHGVSGNKLSQLDTGPHRNLARHFREHGYETALIGKGHLPKNWMEEGFAYRRYCDLTDAEREDPRTCHYFDHLVRRGLADLFDLGYLPEGRPGSRMEAFVSEVPLEDSVEVWTGDQALEFLQSRKVTEPFFLQLSFQRPHDPYAPSVGRDRLYDPEELPLPPNATEFFEHRFHGKPTFQREYASKPAGEGYPYRPLDAADLRRQLAAYYALITTIDEQIGRVLDWLETTGAIENTIIVYHADHGDFAGEHGLMLKNFGIYEAIHRIPWILRYPGCEPGSVDRRLVESVDLYPTLCELAGLESPPNGDGFSLANPLAPERDTVVCEWDFFAPPQDRVYAVRDRRYRLVYYPSAPDDGELYDTVRDPGERVNLWHQADAERARLLGRLVNYLGGLPRLHAPSNDRLVAAATRDSATTKIHSRGVRWSELMRCESH